jgi:hypothetical protein
MSQIVFAEVSAKSPLNIYPNLSEMISNDTLPSVNFCPSKKTHSAGGKTFSQMCDEY